MFLEKYGYDYKEIDIGKYENIPISNILKKIIVNRDPNVDNMLNYINNIDLYKDISKLQYIEEASDLLIKHLDKKSHILICTDSDADGITSAVTAYKSLRDVFDHPISRISVLINKRRDGNGFNNTLVNKILSLNKHRKINLLIALDHGSSDKASYDILKANTDMELLITDHHQVPMDNYPSNVEVLLNPQLPDSKYTRNISGCTVGFLLFIYTYYKKYNKKNIDIFNDIIPYPTISIISDVMSCKDPINRYIYRKGLKEINKYKESDSFLSLRDSLNILNNIRLGDIRMKISPLINAANRMGVEDLGFDVLNSTDYQQAMANIQDLIESNNVKKVAISNISKRLIEELKEKELKNTIVVSIDTVLTINGVIAGRVGDTFKRPTICFVDTKDRGIMTGSCRAILQGFNILKVLKDIQKNNPTVVLNCGGHKSACGLKINSKEYDKFIDLFETYSTKELDQLETSNLIKIDHLLKEDDINLNTFNLISSLEPYGNEFEDPIFLSILTINDIIFLNGLCKIRFKRRKGGYITGFYNLTDKKYTIDTISTVLKYDSKVLVSYTLELSSFRSSLELNLRIIKIDLWEK